MERQKLCASAAAFGLGAVGYPLLELLWRGRTHWTMALTGGSCALLLWKIAGTRLPFPLKCLLSAGAITGTEFAVGCLVNLRLGWDVWDYSGQPYNLLGQICPGYAALWLLLSVPTLGGCGYLQKRFRVSP